MKDSIKLGGMLLAVGAVGGMSCCSNTGCLSCRGKQSTSLLSSSGRSLLLLLSLDLFSILSWDLFLRASVADSIELLQLMGAAVGRGTMAVGVKCHGGLGGIGIENTMVVGVSNLDAT